MALKFRRGTDSGRSAITPAEGEPIFTTDTKKLYVGDGSTAGGIAVDTAVSDGDKGDITVSSSGATWTIDNDAVTYAKMQNVSAASRLLGRGSASGSGDVQELTIGTGLTLTGTELTASGGAQVQVDTFTSSGTWTKPAFAKKVTIFVLPGGPGGGSGARQATTSARSGGAAGGSAGYYSYIAEASQLTSTVSVTVGAGGTGGASVTTDSTNGNAGTAGGSSSFGSYVVSQTHNGGAGGTTSSGSSTPVATPTGFAIPTGTLDGRRGEPSTGSSFTSNLTTLISLSGGGGAGQAANTTTTTNGGKCEPANWLAALGWSFGQGGTNGGNGGNGTNNQLGILYFGSGGGGGSYKTGQATGAGGNGGYGAGGGGGAASDNGFASGAGGNGGGGLVIVVSEG